MGAGLGALELGQQGVFVAAALAGAEQAQPHVRGSQKAATVDAWSVHLVIWPVALLEVLNEAVQQEVPG